MTAIQKAREELRGQLALLHSLANDTTEANWRDKRLYILQTCVRMSDALAAQDAETPATPADVGELVERLRRLADYVDQMQPPLTIREEGDRITYREAATALERVTRERDEARRELAATVRKFNCDNADQFWKNITRIRNRAESAEAKLAEARKVIEPFARVGDKHHSGYLDTEFAYPIIRVGDVRAARLFLEETK